MTPDSGATLSLTPPTIPKKRSADGAELSATQSHTTPPNASQSSSNASFSKKVTVNGKPVVLNSDSDTDSDELEELTIHRRVSPRKKTPARNDLSSRIIINTRSNRWRGDDLHLPTRKLQLPKRSLNRLGEELRRDAAAAARFAAAKAELEVDVEHDIGLDTAQDDLMETMEDDGERRRLHLAMKRTYSSNTDYTFQLFNKTPKISRNAPFPTKCLPNHGWVVNLQDPGRREQSFLFGLANRIFQYQKLPDELAIWMIEELSLGATEVLAERYMQLLESHPETIRTLDVSDIERLFSLIGANMETLRAAEVKPNLDSGKLSQISDLRPLQAIVNLFRRVVVHMGTEAKIYVLSIFCYICMDDSVRINPGTLASVHDLIEITLGTVAGKSEVVSRVKCFHYSKLTEE